MSYKLHLSIESSQEIDVPWALNLVLGLLRPSVVSHIGQVVRIVAKHLLDNKGAFPWRRKLVHPLPILDQTQDKVTLLKGASPDSATVIAAEPLLVDSSARECKFARLV